MYVCVSIAYTSVHRVNRRWAVMMVSADEHNCVNGQRSQGFVFWIRLRLTPFCVETISNFLYIWIFIAAIEYKEGISISWNRKKKYLHNPEVLKIYSEKGDCFCTLSEEFQHFINRIAPNTTYTHLTERNESASMQTIFFYWIYSIGLMEGTQYRQNMEICTYISKMIVGNKYFL